MAYLIDTSVLGRLANTADLLYPVAARAVLELHRRGELLHITPQCLVEFHNVATRPASLNGLGLSNRVAESTAAAFEKVFPLLPETPDIFAAWKGVVHSADVKGKQVYDARLLAVCQVCGISHLLTFNLSHFLRLAKFTPSVIVVDPGSV